MISLNNTQSAARKKHLFASISYGAPLLRIYVTLLTRKTKPSRYLALEPSRGVLKILRWSLSSQARKLSTLWMLSRAPRHRRQSLAVPNGNELRRPPTCPLKKLLNFSYWLFSCWPWKKWKWATQSLLILSLVSYNLTKARSHSRRKYSLISQQWHLRACASTLSLTLIWVYGGKQLLWWMKFRTFLEIARSWLG